ncbi:hypothetical protein BDV33DRAFT_57480 [Aspergillus novoparasiticus]|uniref:C2H2-type domain-containing protein n=1 Tax=Aspergillus novoparasiticus TaxID=986946 RepID=A0A5N6E880_9EURO|nr:hypothetical protein BDV33DRAFT_57480 [Aspergillus novoparasiticus]
MVRSQSKRQRTHVWSHPAVSETQESAFTQVKLYRILAHSVNLPYACPLCLGGYSRYDALYAHFKTTEEPQHRALKNLWFSGRCTVCNEPSDQVLRHMEKRHPESYQSLMKSTLCLRSEVNVMIPASPGCFQHTFLFPLRRSDSIVTLPQRKRKTARPHTRQKIGRVPTTTTQEATSFPSFESADEGMSLLGADETFMFGNNGMIFNSNLYWYRRTKLSN